MGFPRLRRLMMVQIFSDVGEVEYRDDTKQLWINLSLDHYLGLAA